MTAGRRDQLATALADELALHRDIVMGAPGRPHFIDCTCGWDGGQITKAGGGLAGARERWRQHRADALLPVVDRMIRQAQAEALESAADDGDTRGLDPVADYVAGWLRARAAALRASTRGTDQPLGDETTPAGTSTARERDAFRHERNEER